MMLAEPWVREVEWGQRFANWIEWCRRREPEYAKAGSAEGNYRSPQIWEPPGPRPVELNLPDATLLNHVFWQLGRPTRRVLKTLLFWPGRFWSLKKQCQYLGVRELELPQAFYKAERMLENRLRFVEEKRIKTGRSARLRTNHPQE